MIKGFWAQLEKPIYALAPMADVTDDAFRRMFALYGKPAVMFTEFVSTDGLCSVGRKNLMRELQFSEDQRPIVAQIWGNRPENFYESAKLLSQLGFDGIDINMGCPQRKEMEQGTCAALINHPNLAVEIINATKKGAGALPVSVKTRLGVKSVETETWIGTLLQTDVAAITIHARTAREMSKVPARWKEIATAVQLRNRMISQTLILGNGDVKSLADADDRLRQTAVDGIMIGRGAFGNPWLFTSSREVSVREKLEVMVEHAHLFEKVFLPQKNFAIMRKHFKAYCAGFPGASELRVKLMTAEDSGEVERTVEEFVGQNSPQPSLMDSTSSPHVLREGEML